MGIEEEADRTLFIRNLDQRVSEEILFELFVQAGPLCKTKIPKDNEGKQKTFGFAVYRHEVSVPYAMQLLDGTTLFGKTIGVQFRSGSSHSNSPGKQQNTSPGNTPNPHGRITPVQWNSPPYSPSPQNQRTYSSPDSLQKHVVMNNMMLQLHMQQLQQLNGGGLAGAAPRNQPSAGAPGGIGGGSWQQDNPSNWQRQSSQQQYNNNSGGGANDSSSTHHSRSQRYTEESSRHQQNTHNRDNHHHNDRRTGRHHDNSGGRPYDTHRGGQRGNQEGRHRRY
ncbi:RNA-binding protein 7 [Gadus chalcogrammus]|uniref:RNA-binding protein 7 n=1 Tax=Gadus chalcogrammus TaxID=1042646 RepID=UPI0024C4A0E2|nr:RNA-binding protein 7 [Gadus chalcogrammus]